MADYFSGNPVPPPNPGGYRPCPRCAEPVLAEAVVCRWCGSRLAGAGARRFAAAAGMVIGGVLVAVAPILPWVWVVLLGDATLFNLARLAPAGALPLVLVPIALVVCGVVAVVTAAVLREGVAARVTAAVLFVVAGAMGGVLLGDLLTSFSDANQFAQVGPGPWVCVAGALFMLAGAIVPAPAKGIRRSPSRAVFSSVACAVVVVVAALGTVAAVRVGTSSRTAASDLTNVGSLPSAEPGLPPPSPSFEPPITEPPTTEPATTEPTDTEPPTSAGTALADAEAVVESKGYRPYPDTTWPRASGLQVILATVAESGDGYANRAFFFENGRYLGTDTSADSAGIREAWSTSDTVALSYELYNAEDPMCCPTADAAIVRYHWTGSRLVPLDAIPTTDSAANGSRR